jgi:tRNA A37 threonylcarbamoyladenosine biosynthesis protein TsaE
MSIKLTTFAANKNKDGNLINLFIDSANIRSFCDKLKKIAKQFDTVKVTTVIGKSCIGKSTLMNALIAKIFIESKIPSPDYNIFTSASETENQNRQERLL